MKLDNRNIQIACDGGAATGKSTGAKMIAKKYKLKLGELVGERHAKRCVHNERNHQSDGAIGDANGNAHAFSDVEAAAQPGLGRLILWPGKGRQVTPGALSLRANRK